MTTYLWTDGCGQIEVPIPQIAVDDICRREKDSLGLVAWMHLADHIPMDKLLQTHKDIMGYESHPDNVRPWLIYHAAWDCFDNPDFYAEKSKNILKEATL